MPGERGRRGLLLGVLCTFLCAGAIAGCSRSKRVPQGVPTFDGERAFGHLTDQVNLGYRYPGSQAHRWTMEYLRDFLQEYADSLEVQPFDVTFEDTAISLWNLIGYFKGTGQETVLLGAHWDTRPWADEDPDRANRRKPILGANDGASGVAVLLELARLMKETTPPRNVHIVLFDGEDSGKIAGAPWCMGSKFYSLSLKGRKPDYGIVVDMIGDRDLQIFAEDYSEKFAYSVVEKVWKMAKDLGIEEFSRETKHSMYDDHVPLTEVGIPVALIIDFDYPYWHTLEDTPDKCSPQSLEAVGKVLAAIIYSP